MEHAATIFARENIKGKGVKAAAFSKKLGEVEGISPQQVSSLMKSLKISPETLITRGMACKLIFEALP